MSLEKPLELKQNYWIDTWSVLQTKALLKCVITGSGATQVNLYTWREVNALRFHQLAIDIEKVYETGMYVASYPGHSHLFNVTRRVLTRL